MPLLTGQRALRRAARQCMRRCSSPGADRVTWHAYRQRLGGRLDALSGRLREGTWQPGPLRQVPIRTFAGKTLPMVIPTTEDRIVHRALRNAVEPVLEARAFADFVSGFRPRRNRLTAVAQAAGHYAAGCRWVADVDVADVSGGSSAEEVVGWLARWVHDGTFLARVHTALAALPFPIVAGTGLAPLLINLRLVPVDERLAGLRVVRFCDNYCVFAPTQAEAAAAFEEVRAALAAVGLAPSAAKSRVHGQMNPEDLFLITG